MTFADALGLRIGDDRMAADAGALADRLGFRLRLGIGNNGMTADPGASADRLARGAMIRVGCFFCGAAARRRSGDDNPQNERGNGGTARHVFGLSVSLTLARSLEGLRPLSREAGFWFDHGIVPTLLSCRPIPFRARRSIPPRRSMRSGWAPLRASHESWRNQRAGSTANRSLGHRRRRVRHAPAPTSHKYRRD
jgi:hypothetical protein